MRRGPRLPSCNFEDRHGRRRQDQAVSDGARPEADPGRGRGGGADADRVGGGRPGSRRASLDTPRRVVKAYEELLLAAMAKIRARNSRASSPRSRATPTWCWCATSRSLRTANTTWRRFRARRISRYYPRDGVVGLSKLARIVDTFARRLQTQEALTAQIAEADRGPAAAARASP